MRTNLLIATALLLVGLSRPGVANPTAPKTPAPKSPQPDSEYIRRMIPTKIAGTYKNGELVELNFKGRIAYVVRPTGKVDPERRWVWIFPFWLGINDGHGNLQHRSYVEKYLAAGFHVAGINIGTSCGSPTGAALCQEFYEKLIADYHLNRRARLLGQSNGGLMAYAWAFRHPESVDRIAGICPATDFRTWPTLVSVINFPEKGLDYGLTYEQLVKRQSEFNPVDNVAPLAKAGVKILHIHGDKDTLVPTEQNSNTLARRYRELGGSAQVVILPGVAHGGQILYQSEPLLKFLLAD